jgi:2-dehydropantoate 2-reductase
VRIAVLGAGAVGSFIGAALSAEHDVTLIGRNAHVLAVRRKGLLIEGLAEKPFPIKATTGTQPLREADLVFLTTKAYDTTTAARQIRRAGAHAPVVSLQNGLTNIKALRRELAGNPIVGGAIVLGVTRLGAGRIRYAGGGRATVGAASGPTAHARAVAKVLSSARIPTAVTRHLEAVLWEKAIVNAAVNPLTAILRCTNGELLARPESRLISKLAAAEGAAAARAADISAPKDPWPIVELVLRDTPTNRTSMLQDVDAGRPTEIDAITGEIVRVAKRHRVAVPVNKALLNLVLSL